MKGLKQKSILPDCRKITPSYAEFSLRAPSMTTRSFRTRLLDVHRTLGAMILRGERKLTLNHVRTLARHFGVSADVFLA